VDVQDFDRLVRTMASGVSRRSMLKRLAGSAFGGAAASVGLDAPVADAKGNKDKGGNGVCQGVGGACATDRQCCPGLLCGSDFRCGAPGSGASGPSVSTNNSTQVCAGNCAPAGQQTTAQTSGNAGAGASASASVFTFGTLPTFFVDVDCKFDQRVYQSTCVCTSRGPANGPVVRKINLGATDVCANIINQTSKPGKGGGGAQQSSGVTAVTAGNAGNGGVAVASSNGGAVTIGNVNNGGGNTSVSVSAGGGSANANASGGSANVVISGNGNVNVSAGQAQPAVPSTLTVVLDGHVVPGRPTTYWLDTDAGRLPATGPSLVQTDETSPDNGAIAVAGFACQVSSAQPGFDWFGQCQPPAAGMAFDLFDTAGSSTTPVASGTTNNSGRIRFPNLPPGTYKLSPNGSNWCHAESDSVDAQGNVVVKAGADSNVWIFTCAATGGS
jgi:prealbumin domain-containing protein